MRNPAHVVTAALWLAAPAALAQAPPVDGAPPTDPSPHSEQAAPAAEQSEPAAAEPPAPRDHARKLDAAAAELAAWRDASERKPALVSLGTLDDVPEEVDALAEFLKDRLKLLSRKKVSNRQWREYWQKQQATATALAARYRSLGGAPALARAEAMERWAELAGAKIRNQDAYLNAIESGRDAVEERLEGILQPVELEPTEGAEELTPVAIVDAEELTPFARRSRRLKVLRRRSALQEQKRKEADLRLRLVRRQMEAQALTDEALQSDLALGATELAIARQESINGDEAWRTLWAPIADAAAVKVGLLEAEVSLGEQRSRSLEVEASLLESQIAYRSAKQAELAATIDEASSAAGWFEASWQTVVEWLRSRGWQVALILLLIFVTMKVAIRLLGALTRWVLRAVEDDDPDHVSQSEARAATLASVVEGVLRVSVYGVGLLVALDQIGVNTGPILGSVAILGLAISFGSQNLVRDIVNGFFILVENQFAVGDVIEAAGRSGTVEQINLRSTRLREFSGILHVIPNGQITSVANKSRDWARAVVHIGVAYGTDIGRVEAAVARVGEEVAASEAWRDIIVDPPTFIGVTSLDDSAVVVRIAAKVDPGNQWALDRDLKRRLHDAFGAAGIEIPFPQQVVWHRQEADTPPAP